MKYGSKNGHANPSTNRGGQCHKSNPDGSGGKSSGSPSPETLAAKGVTHATPITEKPSELGMGTHGMSEKPQAIAKGKVGGDRGNFRWR